MFRKDVLLKSNIKLKSSDKKKFASSVSSKYPEIRSEIEFKGDVFHLKVTIHDGRRIEIYVVNDEPWIFIDDGQWYPSVYFLWKYPEALYTYVTHPSVLMKLQEGADLMLPGVIVEGELTMRKLGKLDKGAPCAVTLQGNRAAVAVGKTNISSRDMFECGMRGKGVQILHVVGDFLWKMGSKEPVPMIPVALPQESLEEQSAPVTLESIALPSNNAAAVEQSASGQLDNGGDSKKRLENENENIEETPPQEEPPTPSSDELFKDYFLRSIKEKMSAKDFPILASTFLGSILLPYMEECGQRVNVKDTGYKKFSTFLTAMKDEGVINIEERQKGVQWISTVNLGHDLFSSIRRSVPACSTSTVPAKSSGKKSGAAEFKEMFSISAAVLPLIRQIRPDAKKSDPISAPDFRTVISDYVKSRQLQNGTQVKLDDLLIQCLNSGVAMRNCPSDMSWEMLFKNLFSKMQPCYEFHFADGQSGVKKGKTPNIIISVARRAGNKRVTLINNLESMGIEPAPFARELQIALAASATLNDVPTSVGAQVQVQGDDTANVIKILTQKYNVPNKVIKIV